MAAILSTIFISFLGHTPGTGAMNNTEFQTLKKENILKKHNATTHKFKR